MRTLILLIFTALGLNAAEDRTMYFTDGSKPGQETPIAAEPVTSKAGSPVKLHLNIRTRSVADQNTFAHIVIDDYRYDEPNYFEDKRVPNIIIEVTDLDGKPIPFRAASSGGGGSAEFLGVSVHLYIGGDPDQLERETTKIYLEVAAKKLKPEEAFPLLDALQQKFTPNQPGTYRLLAIYRPKVPGKWAGELATTPATIVISKEKEE